MPPEKVRKYRRYTCVGCRRDFFAVQIRRDKRQQRIQAKDLMCPYDDCPTTGILDVEVKAESIYLDIKK